MAVTHSVVNFSMVDTCNSRSRMLLGRSYGNHPALWVAVAQPRAVPDGWALDLRPVCEHPGQLHAVDDDGAVARVSRRSIITSAEVKWLQHTEQAVRLCPNLSGATMPPVEFGDYELDDTPSQAIRVANTPFHTQRAHSLQPVWRPTSIAPLWVCATHAALYRKRDDTKDTTTTSD